MDFAHIAPTKFLQSFTRTNGCDLVLAHLVDDDMTGKTPDREYTKFYASSDRYKIMDNSAYEKYIRNEPMFPPEQLITLARFCRADMIVLPDVPENAVKTIELCEKYVKDFRREGFDVMFVPQSRIGNYEEYLTTIDYGVSNMGPGDRIGISIIGAPNALNCYNTPFQRYLARYKVFSDLYERKILQRAGFQKFHCLGLLDGPNEISLLKPWRPYIASWDSSLAVWSGLNAVKFDQSPTGLRDGKIQTPVDFDQDYIEPEDLSLVLHNIDYIDSLVRK